MMAPAGVELATLVSEMSKRKKAVKTSRAS